MSTKMWSLCWLVSFQSFMLLAAVDFGVEENLRFYTLCRRQHEDCLLVVYGSADTTSDDGCRVTCANKREGLNDFMTVYFCKEDEETCEPYEVYGREGYLRTFERHVMCVQKCHFIRRVEHHSQDDFDICSKVFEPCTEIKKINGSFDTFNKCAFQCDGWPNMENSVVDTLYFCPRKAHCESAKYLITPGTTHGFEELMACFNSCLSGLAPTEFTATALNSSAIRVTWKKPRRSGELSGKYELVVRNSTHEDKLYIRANENIIGDLEPSTTYNLTVRAFWSNGTPADAVAFTSVTTLPREYRDDSPTYELCEKQHRDCTLVHYRAEDKTKGAGCRDVCGMQRGDLNEKMTVYFCEEYTKPCKPYEVYGRSGYAENFERHVMCVSLCHFVAKVEHSSVDYVNMFSVNTYFILEIRRINGTFGAFNKCVFEYDGWPKLENSLEDTAIFCPDEGICVQAKFFSSPETGNAYADLSTCVTNYMSVAIGGGLNVAFVFRNKYEELNGRAAVPRWNLVAKFITRNCIRPFSSGITQLQSTTPGSAFAPGLSIKCFKGIRFTTRT